MPIQLTTAFQTGDADEQDYSHVAIRKVEVRLEADVIRFHTRHGIYSGGVFTPGKILRGQTAQTFELRGSDYTSILSELCSSTDEKVYDEVARVLYEWLIDNEHFSGTVV